MPRAEENQSPKGMPYGERKKTADYQQATQPPTAPATQPQPGPAAASAPQAGADPSLMEALLGETARPDEPVNFGLAEFEQEEIESLRDWLPVLMDLASDPAADDYIKGIAARAQVAFGGR